MNSRGVLLDVTKTSSRSNIYKLNHLANNKKRLEIRKKEEKKELAKKDRRLLDGPQNVTEYAADIHRLLISTAMRTRPSHRYLKTIQRGKLDHKHRLSLIETTIQHLHDQRVKKFQTVFLAINIIDRFLSNQMLTPDWLRCLGFAAMMLACKYEEIYPPDLSDWCYLARGFHNRGELLEMELIVYESLDHSLVTVSAADLFQRYQRIEDYVLESLQQHFKMGMYLLEIAACHYQMLRYSQNEVACAVLILANQVYSFPGWTPGLTADSGLAWKELKNVTIDLARIADNVAVTNPIFRRYAMASQKCVAKHPRLREILAEFMHVNKFDKPPMQTKEIRQYKISGQYPGMA